MEFWERLYEDVNWIQLCDDTVQWHVGFCEAGNFLTGTMIEVKVKVCLCAPEFCLEWGCGAAHSYPRH